MAGFRPRLLGSDEELVDMETSPVLRDIPDLYLLCDKWNEGSQFSEHLVVELKRPSVRIQPKHVSKLQRYANEIANHPSWGQRVDSHQFTFVLVSADVSDDVKSMYQAHEEAGLLSRPKLAHPTELWALRWSDLIDRRRAELRFLESALEITADAELLECLKSRVGEFLPVEARSDE